MSGKDDMNDNTSSTDLQQDVVTRTVGFAETPISDEGSFLFRTREGLPIRDSLELAADLTSGLKMLCDVISEAINYDHIVLVDEMRALAFLSDAANALIKASKPRVEGGAA